jgi:hypothetical protein
VNSLQGYLVVILLAAAADGHSCGTRGVPLEIFDYQDTPLRNYSDLNDIVQRVSKNANVQRLIDSNADVVAADGETTTFQWHFGTFRFVLWTYEQCTKTGLFVNSIVVSVSGHLTNNRASCLVSDLRGKSTTSLPIVAINEQLVRRSVACDAWLVAHSEGRDPFSTIEARPKFELNADLPPVLAPIQLEKLNAPIPDVERERDKPQEDLER